MYKKKSFLFPNRISDCVFVHNIHSYPKIYICCYLKKFYVVYYFHNSVSVVLRIQNISTYMKYNNIEMKFTNRTKKNRMLEEKKM